ncbi:MAG TPA: hypothetical protein VJ835_12060 [Fimbriimonadaceae bacterium]|nr:hypothetical protein [Fimbriimonadaceae bacterium]
MRLETAEDVGRLMLIIVPLILAVVIGGFIAFIKWSRKDRGVDDWRDR